MGSSDSKSVSGAIPMRRPLAAGLRAAVVLVLAPVALTQPVGETPAYRAGGLDVAVASPGHGVQQEKPGEGEDKNQRVTGNVVDRDGKAADRVQVEFDGPKRETVWTDSRGEFSFTGPPGDYLVTVKTGESQQQFEVRIEDNRLIPSTLELDPEPLG